MQRILIIDDNDDLRELLRQALELEGYAVRTAANGERGLDALAAEEYSVVVTDIFMPGKEGIETIAELRRRFPATRIIAMTGRISATDFDPLAVASELGADSTLRKPFDASVLIERLRLLRPAGPVAER